MVERLHGTLKDRTKPARGLGSNRKSRRDRIETIENLLKGWEVHYNFVRPHTSLGGKIPAEVAGVEGLNDWRTLIKQLKFSVSIGNSFLFHWSECVFFFQSKCGWTRLYMINL
ncbi:MAG: hypothetical protein DRO98_00925 [Archaeoglobales archaeon]|nr:MAG: hypothetical protein DRO98_00925 [Archaeoglobales archaeon]